MGRILVGFGLGVSVSVGVICSGIGRPMAHGSQKPPVRSYAALPVLLSIPA